MADCSPENLSSYRDHVLLERSPGSEDSPKNASRDNGVDFAGPFDGEQHKASANESVNEQVHHHAEGTPIDVSFTVVTQTKGGEAVFPKVMVGIAFHFGSVIFESLVWIENSGDEGIGQAFRKQAPAFVGDFAGHFFDGSTEVLEVSGPAVRLRHHVFIQQFRGRERLHGQFLKLGERRCAVNEHGLRALTLRQEFPVFPFHCLPEQHQSEQGNQNRGNPKEGAPVDAANTGERSHNEQRKRKTIWYFYFYILSVLSWLVYIFYRVIESVYYAERRG